MKQYHHLTGEQRYYLSVRLQAGTNLKEIASNLNVSPGTLSREIGRNSVCGLYDADAADRKSRERRSCRRKPHVLTGTLFERVIEGLKRRSSPERMTGYEIAFKVKSRKAQTVAAGIVRNLKASRLPVLSITFDNGHEFSHHRTVSSRLGCPVYFSLPHHPWERGTNENTNGLLRDFFPKGESLLKVTGKQIRKAMDNLNGRPRKRFGYLTPNEMVELKLAAASLSPATKATQNKVKQQKTNQSEVLHLQC